MDGIRMSVYYAYHPDHVLDEIMKFDKKPRHPNASEKLMVKAAPGETERRLEELINELRPLTVESLREMEDVDEQDLVDLSQLGP